jgi:chromosome segregation ATPase
MFGRFQRCYNDEQDLVHIVSTWERRRCDDLQRAGDENNYILARQENLLHRIRELTIERDEARQNVAVQSDELSHLRQEVCMHNATIIELKQKLATAERQVPTERADVSSTALERTRPQCPPRDRRLALLAYVESLTVSRAIAFSELARVRQEMRRLAVLSYMHRAHSSATGCRCNTYEAKCAEE